MSSQNKDEYKSVLAHTPTINTVKSKEEGQQRPSWIKRKYLLIKKAAGDFWVVGRYGFQLGGLAGVILGTIFGGYESMRMKSFWPLPIAMFSSGFTFGCIFAISSVLRAKDNNEGEIFPQYEIIWYDSTKGSWVRKSKEINEKYANKRF
jgi:hypothetical protein